MVKLEQVIKTNSFKSELHKACINLLYSSWWLKTVFSRDLKSLDITQEQFNVMRILKGKHPEKMNVKDIACRMIEQNSNVPRIIDRLEKKEWVTRAQCTNDARHSNIGLSLIGIEILTKANKIVDEVSNTKVNLTEVEALELNTLLEKMRL